MFNMSKADVEQYYDEMGKKNLPHYQETHSAFDVWLQKTIEGFILKFIIKEVGQKGKVLTDVGCGHGQFSLGLLRHNAFEKLFLNDLSAEMLQIAQEKINQSFPDTLVTTIKGSITDSEIQLPLSDVSLMIGVLNHLNRDERLIAFNKIRQSGAKILCCSFAHQGFLLHKKVGTFFHQLGIPYTPLIPDELKKEAEAAGFSLKRIDYPFMLPVFSPMAVVSFSAK
jgi:ubiquinone/menaquinone biosynthesis C-methylase UbiE